MVKGLKKWRKIITNQLLIFLAPIIRSFEKIKFKVKEREVPPPIFIVGAPRTGSTILYQALTNTYSLTYIDNDACGWHRNLRFGLWLSQKKYKDAPHNNFEADHGNTCKYGGHAPSECGQFWYRWLPTDRHFVDFPEITDEMVKGIREEVLGASSFLKQPLLFKNLNAGQRLRLIHKAFPEARIIFVRRDPRFVTRSILRARERIGIVEGQWWSVMPPNVSTLKKLPENEMCAAQVYSLEQQIEQDLSLFPAANIRQVHYQAFSEELVHDLGNWLGVSRRNGDKIPEFNRDDLERLGDAERKELDALVEKYPFSKDLFV